jgi:arginine:ornithine antiporter / lysine permease
MVQLFLILTLVSKASYLALISLSTAMILVPYLFSAVYGVKVAWSQEKRAQAAIKNIAQSDYIKPVAVIAALYCLWLLYAAGIKYLLLSALLYAPGALVYFWAKQQRHERAFTATEWVILAVLAALAVVAAYLLATQKITF